MQLTVHPPDTVPAATESSDRIPEMKRHVSSSEGYDTMTDATSEAMSEVTVNTSDNQRHIHKLCDKFGKNNVMGKEKKLVLLML